MTPPPEAGPVTVRAIRPDEASAYRRVRLAALADSPDAFTEPHAVAAQLGEQVWAERVASSLRGDTRVVVADAGGELVGLTVGIPYEGRARVVSVWVHPAWRGQGLAATMIEQVCTWAAGAGYAEIQIETAVGNPAPRRLYERLGFQPSDLVPPAGCDPVLVRRLA